MTTYTFGLRCNMTQKPMIVLTGPTAVGKTALSIELAKKINGAIRYFLWCFQGLFSGGRIMYTM